MKKAAALLAIICIYCEITFGQNQSVQPVRIGIELELSNDRTIDGFFDYFTVKPITDDIPRRFRKYIPEGFVESYLSDNLDNLDRLPPELKEKLTSGIEQHEAGVLGADGKPVESKIAGIITGDVEIPKSVQSEFSNRVGPISIDNIQIVDSFLEFDSLSFHGHQQIFERVEWTLQKI